jgi:D-3-phosphoglycerate dehydrogenase
MVSLLGQHKINIAGMHVGRSEPRPGGPSVMVLALDNPVPDDILDQLRKIAGIMTAQLVEL